MTGLIQSKLLILLLTVMRSGLTQEEKKVKVANSRSYQTPTVSFVTAPQTLQYYAAAPLYTSIPTVFIPNQLGLSATPIAQYALPPSNDPKPFAEFHPDTSTSVHSDARQNLPVVATSHLVKAKPTHGYLLGEKRYKSYVKTVQEHPVKVKVSLPYKYPKSQKITSYTIRPSIDLSHQFNQEASSNLQPSTLEPPIASTYGPAMAVDIQQKIRVPVVSAHPTTYHRLKGPSHHHGAVYIPKKKRVYTHIHKDHIHNHHFPSNHPVLIHKIPQSTRQTGSSYPPPPPPSPTPTTPLEIKPVQENSQIAYAYQSSNQVRFPEIASKDTLKVHSTPGEVTQAIIKKPGLIQNYDASIPIKVPSQKPYRFHVNEILKNSDLHFVQESTRTGSHDYATDPQNSVPVQPDTKFPPQSVLVYNSHQGVYTPMIVDHHQANVIAGSSPLDMYAYQGPHAYQSNQIIPDQDLGTSETIRIPVAVIRGAHNIAGQGMFGFAVKSQEEKGSEDFRPSRRTSDWIPMSGNGIPIKTPSEEGTIEGSKPTAPAPQTDTSKLGDIIAAKIPKEFSQQTKALAQSQRDSDIVTGKIPFVRTFPPETDRRKGSVIDVYPVSRDGSTKMGDTSNLVVSSVIKFS